MVAYEHHRITTAAATRVHYDSRGAHRPAAWSTSATCTTPSAPVARIATPGPPPKPSTYIQGRAGTEFDPAMVAPFIEMMRQWDDRIALQEIA